MMWGPSQTYTIQSITVFDVVDCTMLQWLGLVLIMIQYAVTGKASGGCHMLALIKILQAKKPDNAWEIEPLPALVIHRYEIYVYALRTF